MIKAPNGLELSGPAKTPSDYRAELAGSALEDPAFFAGQRVVSPHQPVFSLLAKGRDTGSFMLVSRPALTRTTAMASLPPGIASFHRAVVLHPLSKDCDAQDIPYRHPVPSISPWSCELVRDSWSRAAP